MESLNGKTINQLEHIGVEKCKEKYPSNRTRKSGEKVNILENKEEQLEYEKIIDKALNNIKKENTAREINENKKYNYRNR